MSGKTDAEIEEYCSKIIGFLHDLNMAEKYRVISSLYESLKDTIEAEGGTIYENREGEKK
jgi:hypothetical protein